MDIIEVAIIQEEIISGIIDSYTNFYINGRNLIDIIQDIENQYRQGNIGLSHMGIQPKYFLDLYERFIPGSTYLLQCGDCGELGCWPIMARIRYENDTVVWDEFENPHRGKDSLAGHWEYKLKFVFEKKQYELEFIKITDYLKTHN